MKKKFIPTIIPLSKLNILLEATCIFLLYLLVPYLIGSDDLFLCD